MTCKEVNEFLAEYLDGTLPWRQRLSFNVHLMICQHCRQYLASYVATIRATRPLDRPSESAGEQVPAELVHAILTARRNQFNSGTEGKSPGADQ